MYVEEIRKYLRNTDMSLKDIGLKCNVSPRTVSNINSGKSHFKEELNYPLRITGIKLSELKSKLSIPTQKAVQNPHILSPQLLDYIGFLSLMGVGVEALLEFKEVYYKQLREIFNKDLNDSELKSILELRPTRPAHLRKMLSAYDNPQVKFINTEYWVKTGLIEDREREALYSLLLKR